MTFQPGHQKGTLTLNATVGTTSSANCPFPITFTRDVLPDAWGRTLSAGLPCSARTVDGETTDLQADDRHLELLAEEDVPEPLQ